MMTRRAGFASGGQLCAAMIAVFHYSGGSWLLWKQFPQFFLQAELNIRLLVQQTDDLRDAPQDAAQK